jgi:transposase-like protein
MAAIKAPQFKDEDNARAFLESVRWPNGPVCPHCAHQGGWPIKGGRPGLYKCASYHCRKQFSVTVGTVFERSKIPLSKWLLAAHLLCCSKKGISSHQLHRMLGVTYKTAWFLSHRIREAMKDGGAGMLGGPGTSGIVEADETYFGKTRGQGKGAHLGKKQKVLALVERDGPVRAFHVPQVTAATLKPILEGQIAEGARLMTDTSPVYGKIGGSFKSHETVNHQKKEYARGDVTTNTVEGFFGVLKRGMTGTYQHCASKHLHRYVNEFAFRYNHRAALEIDDQQRVVDTLKGIGGKRLTYR